MAHELRVAPGAPEAPAGRQGLGAGKGLYFSSADRR